MTDNNGYNDEGVRARLRAKADLNEQYGKRADDATYAQPHYGQDYTPVRHPAGRVAIIDRTPNVAIKSPEARRIINYIIGVVSVAIAAAIAVDAASADINISAITLPVAAGWGVISAAFIGGVTAPNIPKA